MSSLAEIIDLEHKINDRRKSNDLAASELKKVHAEIDRATAALDEAKGKLTYHANNLKHMKSKADIVDLKEFISTKNHLRDAKEDVDEANFDLSKARKKEEALAKKIVDNTKEIGQTRQLLKRYGRLIPFERVP